MKLTSNRRGPVKSLVLVCLALVLTACGSGSGSYDLSSVAKAEAVSCSDVVSVSNAVTAADHASPVGNRNSQLQKLHLTSANVKTIENALLQRAASCQQVSASKSPTTTNTATVQSGNGKKQIVPLINSANGSATASTIRDSQTPASLPAGLCPTLVNWKTLVTCVDQHHLQWYIDGVNQRKSETGFDWSDITRWANAKNTSTVEVRAIEVYGQGISAAEARQRAVALVGQAGATMVMIHQPACFDNTRGLKFGQMSDFVYCPPGSRQVRVSLLPVVMKNGEIVAIRDTQSGVFVDCDNVWWIPMITVHNQCITHCRPVPPTHRSRCASGYVYNPPDKYYPNGVCLQSKSSNPKDYTYPVGKPKATVTTPAESNPPSVSTTQTGGGGTVDTPTNSPGSATGGTAPGTTSSTPRPTPTQSPATGANDGSGGTVSNPF